MKENRSKSKEKIQNVEDSLCLLEDKVLPSFLVPRLPSLEEVVALKQEKHRKVSEKRQEILKAVSMKNWAHGKAVAEKREAAKLKLAKKQAAQLEGLVAKERSLRERLIEEEESSPKQELEQSANQISRVKELEKTRKQVEARQQKREQSVQELRVRMQVYPGCTRG